MDRLPSETDPIPSAPASGTAPGKRVLIVDDAPDARMCIARELASLGFEVDGAATPEEAIERVRAQRHDLVVIDVNLGHEIDGFELTRRLLAEPGREELRVVIVSGLVREHTVVDAREAGAFTAIEKPNSWSGFGAVVAPLVA